jgi:hypothetical protein
MEAKLTWHLFWKENQLVRTQKNSAKKKESSPFGEPRIKLGTKVHSNSRIQFGEPRIKLGTKVHSNSRIQFGEPRIELRTKVHSNSRIQFGEPRIELGTKVHSNSRIQFASNEYKLVPRKLDPGPSSSKVGLSRGPRRKEEEEESRYLVQVPTGHDSQPLVLDCIPVASAAAAAAAVVVAESTH